MCARQPIEVRSSFLVYRRLTTPLVFFMYQIPVADRAVLDRLTQDSR